MGPPLTTYNRFSKMMISKCPSKMAHRVGQLSIRQKRLLRNSGFNVSKNIRFFEMLKPMSSKYANKRANSDFALCNNDQRSDPIESYTIY